MSSSLTDVVVMPMGGGKTTTCQDPYYLDFDAMYSLVETQETYDRVNLKLLAFLDERKLVSTKTLEDHRRRIRECSGPARCLLVHSINLARLSGLNIRAVVIPTPQLHTEATAERSYISRKLATLNRETILAQCDVFGLTPQTFDDWAILKNFLNDLKIEDGAPKAEDTQRNDSCCDEIPKRRSAEIEKWDEECLVQLIASGLGAKFKEELANDEV